MRAGAATLAFAIIAVLAPLGGQTASAAGDVGFGKSLLAGQASVHPTTLQFGPDGRLYVGELDGVIRVYSIDRLGYNQYSVTATETIDNVANIRNHDDDGTPRPDVPGRLVTGLLVIGTAAHPVLYVSSSDPRFGGDAAGGVDIGLDTNSGVISRLRWTGTLWRMRNLVRGIPRSEEVHAPNGLALDAATNTLYLAVGGFTNMGAPSAAFGTTPEYALSGAILSVDLNAIGSTTYDLPTLNDPTRPGNPDANDPFGGNDGLNQAKLVPGGPVQIYSPGYRNPYDVVLTQGGRLYATDNGPNAGVGDVPVGEGTPGCTNAVQEGGISAEDSLHLVEAGDYGGHPNPTRANTANTFGGQSPVTTGDPQQCDWLAPGPARGSLTTFPESTDGIAEYTASNFSGAMTGDLLLTTLADNLVYRIELNPAGDSVVSKTSLFSNVGKRPLDVTTQGDNDVFPGTIWVVDYLANKILVFEPNDYGGTPGPCTGTDDPNLDDDGDGFSNADEIDNGTDPCSAADVPPDADNDRISNLNDPDDDNDGLPDTSDPFALDPDNGTTTTIPVHRTWDPGSPGQAGVASTGFTGLMTNGVNDYETLFDPSKMSVGTATGTLSIDSVTAGTAHGASNSQEYGFQLGFAPGTSPFKVQTRVVAPFSGVTPQPGQSFGVQLGSGGQDDYVELSVAAGSGSGAVTFRQEVGGAVSNQRSKVVAMPGPDAVILSLIVDPVARTIQPRYAVESGGTIGPTVKIGTPVSYPSSWSASGALAVGIISTSQGATPFPATWDYLKVTPTA